MRPEVCCEADAEVAGEIRAAIEQVDFRTDPPNFALQSSSQPLEATAPYLCAEEGHELVAHAQLRVDEE